MQESEKVRNFASKMQNDGKVANFPSVEHLMKDARKRPEGRGLIANKLIKSNSILWQKKTLLFW